MSETETETKKIETAAECTAAGGTWNEEDSTCKIPEPAATEEGKVITTVKKGNLNLEQRIMGVMQDVFDTKIKALEVRIDEKIDELLKTKEVEMEQALRKGFGLENDPTIHKSDMIAFFRKAQLESTTSQKKTPAAIEKAGPAGSKSTNPLDQMYDNFGGNK